MTANMLVNDKAPNEIVGIGVLCIRTVMMRSLPELQKPVWHSEDSAQLSGSDMESSLTPS